MKKNLLCSVLIFSIALFLSGSMFAQTWSDVVEEDKGDTLVVKGFSNSGGIVNSLYIAIAGDTTASGERTNANRVYKTMVGQVYMQDGTYEFDATLPNLVITADKVDRTGSTMPPLHIKKLQADGSFDKTLFQTPGSISIENQYFALSLIGETLDREFARAEGIGTRMEYTNCIFEFTNWVLHFPRAVDQTFKFTDCLFINVGNEATLEKGLVFDSWMPVDTLWFENNTVLNAGGVAIGRPDVAPGFAYFNHNTFVNTTLNPMLFFSQAEMVATNNLIINTGIIPDFPGFYEFHEDDDQLPKGVINVDTVEADMISNHWEDGYPQAGYQLTDAQRKIMVDKNNTWWDPRFVAMYTDNELPVIPDSINETWAHQMFNMNTRTKAMFDDNTAYPYFVEGTWMNEEPDFANNKDLVAEWKAFIISNSTAGAPGGGDNMPWWRTEDRANVTQPDWPPLADLSYTNATLMAGGINGFPVGDLNWFPAKKTEWAATGESSQLLTALAAGELVATGINDRISTEINEVSVYPNPVTNVSSVKFELANASNVEMVLYNIVGEKVRVVNLGSRSQGIHEVTLNKGGLSAGMYILQINTEFSKAGYATKITIK
jgi:hypothetical protein